jgi:hypothetical protein
MRSPDLLWIGTGKGIARTSDGGVSWTSFRDVPEFANLGIFAIAVRGDTVWASTGYNKSVEGSDVQTGSGFSYSLDNGTTWHQRPQPLDAPSDSLVQYGVDSATANTVNFLPITVPEQNVTFDIALTSDAVWVTSWSSGLRKSTDLGATWQRTVLPNALRNSIAPTDTLRNYEIDPRNDNNFLAFSVYAQTDSVIWVGTAGGINKSTDGGHSWTKFTTQNQGSPILGNWVIAIAGQQLGTTTRIWTTNWVAGEGEQFGVSYSDDDGRIWVNALYGIRAYAFAFHDSVAYVATDNGLYRTSDGGSQWNSSGTIVDTETGASVTSSAVFAVATIDDTVYCGTGDGMARTIDNTSSPFGQHWQVFRAFQPLGNAGQAYAYPNPFSPRSGVTRIHYSTGGHDGQVTIELFDFGMNRVRTIIRDVSRSGSSEHEELWNGRDDNNSTVANGVYYYRVVIDSGEPVWGKIMVLQ